MSPTAHCVQAVLCLVLSVSSTLHVRRIARLRAEMEETPVLPLWVVAACATSWVGTTFVVIVAVASLGGAA